MSRPASCSGAVGLEPLHRLGGRALEEQRHDLHQPADADHQDDQHDQPGHVLLQELVTRDCGHLDLAIVMFSGTLSAQACRSGGAASTGASTGLAPTTVFHTL